MSAHLLVYSLCEEHRIAPRVSVIPLLVHKSNVIEHEMVLAVSIVHV